MAVVTVLAGVIAGYTASHGGKTYQASSSILVSPLPEGQSSTLGIGTVVDTGDPARTIQTAAALIDTQQAAQAAAKILGNGWTAGAVKSAVGVSPARRQQRRGGDGSRVKPAGRRSRGQRVRAGRDRLPRLGRATAGRS